MRRYLITLHARTTAGGRVSRASAGVEIDGAPVALEGDTVECPACAGRGRIVCVGPRIPETWNGRHLALENDLCSCRCVPPPRLLPRQSLRAQVLKDCGGALATPVEPSVPARRARPAFGGRYLLLDAHTGAPLAHREYAVVRAGGRLEFGRSDALGQTHLLASPAGTHGHEVVDIYL